MWDLEGGGWGVEPPFQMEAGWGRQPQGEGLDLYGALVSLWDFPTGLNRPRVRQEKAMKGE